MRETLDDGMFYDTCEDAMDHWDDDWVVCPVCQGYIIEERVDGLVIKRPQHKPVNKTKH